MKNCKNTGKATIHVNEKVIHNDKKINRILVAIDFSEPSFNALETAACIAEKCGATLYLIHVQDNIFDFMGVSSLTMNSVANNSSSILTALATDIQRKSGIKPVIIEEPAM